MKKLLTAFSMAFGMFCAIPNPVKLWDNSLRSLQLVCFPWVGAVIGLLWAGAAWVLGYCGLDGLLGAAILTALPLLLTGFIHLDGFMDCCDAIYSRRDREERLRILKDSHCGAFAVIHLAIYLLLFLGAMERTVPGALIAIPVAVRCVSALCVALLKPLGSSQYAQGRYPQGHIAALVVELVLALAVPVVLLGLPGLSAAAAAAVAGLTVSMAVKDLGGMSGDISGFAITRGELGGVIALAVLGMCGA